MERNENDSLELEMIARVEYIHLLLFMYYSTFNRNYKWQVMYPHQKNIRFYSFQNAGCSTCKCKYMFTSMQLISLNEKFVLLLFLKEES